MTVLNNMNQIDKVESLKVFKTIFVNINKYPNENKYRTLKVSNVKLFNNLH
jgi:hypothetical protein